ncbi:7 transmembrane receptor [Aphelenchoides fujianensis]|nr:7 transmembrane receptor [Aphelenchoides fujianensis]
MEACEGEPPLFQMDDPTTQQFIRQLAAFRSFYGPIHGYICVFLCIFGFTSNLIHVIVLTRRSMRSSAVNAIMTAVALCDMGTMLSYLGVHLPLCAEESGCERVVNESGKEANRLQNVLSNLWMYFLLAHMFLSITLHTTTLWLAVLMAFMRIMTLKSAVLNSKYQNSRLAKRISLGVFLLVIVFTIPTFLVHEIVEYPLDRWEPVFNECQHYGFPVNYSEPIYTLARSPRAQTNGCRLFKWNLWLTGLLFKVIPCLLLIFLSSSLLLKLRRAEKKRQVLLLNSGSDGSKRIASDRTTAMLLAILAVFLITEMPQGVLSILSAVRTNDVHNIVLLYGFRYRHTFCVTILPAAFWLRCSETVPHINSAPLTNTDFPSRLFAVRNGADVNENWAAPINRRRSSPGVRMLRQSLDASPRIPLSARPSRVG